MKTDKKNIRNMILTIVASIAGFAIGYLIVNSLFTSPSGFDKQLMKAAEEINNVCPIMVDSGTRLDNAISIPGNKLAYNYTLVNLLKADIDIDGFSVLRSRHTSIKSHYQPGISQLARATRQFYTGSRMMIRIAWQIHF